MNMQMTHAAMSALLSRLVSEGRITEAELLPDFSQAMANALGTMVETFKQPVWRNPKTGNQASSVHAAFLALGFTTSKHWSAVANEARKFTSFHEKRGLPLLA